MIKSISLLAAAIAVVGAGLTAPAPAAAQSTFTAAQQGTTCDPQKTNTTGAYTSTGATAFGSDTCSNNGITVGLTVWGYTGGSTIPATTSAAGGFTQGNLGDFNSNGFGAYTGTNETQGTSQHAFDNYASGCGTGGSDANPYSGPTTAGGGTAAVAVSSKNGGCGGAIEGLLMNFSSAVSLKSVSIGYSGTDADLSVYVWTGGGTGPDMTKQTISNDAANGLAGWTLVGSNSMAAVTAQNTTSSYTLPSSLYSSYFLVTTYFGANNGNLDYGNDSFKINGWTTTAACSGTVNSGTGVCSTGTKVPEPASLALVAVALLGAGTVTRRKSAKR